MNERPCQWLSHPLPTGELLPVRRYGPAGAARRAVVALHGMMSHSGWFFELGAALAQRGVALYASDRRGSGRSSSLPGLGELGSWMSDVSEVTALARREAEHVTLLGWCGGARTALASAAVEGGSPRIDAVLLAAPALAFSPYLAERFKRLVSSEGEDLPLPFEPLDDFSLMPRVRDYISTDAARWTRTPRAFLAPARQALERALEGLGRLSVPVRCVLATDDRLIDNGATTRLLAGMPVASLVGAHALVLEQPEALATALVDAEQFF